MVFQRGSTQDSTKGDVVKSWTGFENEYHSSATSWPWYGDRKSVNTVTFKGIINPVNASFMFYGFENMHTFDGTNLDLSSASSISQMFAYCYDLVSVECGGWNTENITDMDSLFLYCKSLTSVDVGRWNTAKVRSMYNMFQNCSSLKELDLS